MSGPDYSFRKDVPILSAPVDGCVVDNTIDDVSALTMFPNGISFSGFDLNDQQRIPPEILASNLGTLKAKKQIPDFLTSIDDQIAIDTQFYQNIKMEYCWYENRYSYLLGKYLKLLTSDNKADITLSQSMNGATTNLNKRLQSLLEIMNAVSNERAKKVDTYRGHLVDGNSVINANITKLAALKAKMNAGNLRLTTQREMMKYTEEKNRALRVQITVFAVLNVVALGVVYTAYRQSV